MTPPCGRAHTVGVRVALKESSDERWIAIAVVSGLASPAGYALFQDSPPDTVAFVLAFAVAFTVQTLD
jgi:hypothetical protein